VHLSPGFSVAEVKVPDVFVGKTLRQIDARGTFGVNIVAIKKRQPEITELGERTFKERLENVPAPDEELDENDILVVVGQDQNIERFSKG